MLMTMLSIGMKASAQQPYAALNEDKTVLTFYYDNQKTARGGMSIGPFSGETYPNWYNQRDFIQTVKFNESFAQCSTITSTAHWFHNCNNITTIVGIENLNTINVTDMSYMFSNCYKLTRLDLSNFNTANVANMNEMFSNCTGLTSLDLTSFNIENTNGVFYNMFGGCEALITIWAGDWSKYAENWKLSSEEVVSLFTGCNSLTGERGTKYSEENRGIAYAHIDGGPDNPGYFSQSETGAPKVPYTILSDDKKTLTFYYDNQYVSNSKAEIITTPRYTDASPWDDDKYTITDVVFDASFADCTTLSSTKNWFHGFRKLTTIRGIEYLNTSNVTDMSWMFCGCDLLRRLDLTKFKTNNVTNMSFMFSGCRTLTTIFGSDWDTSKVTDGTHMFDTCGLLVGNQGTSYSSSNTDYTFAHLDGGSDNPGYFSNKATNNSDTPYTILSDDKKTLTLYYDNQYAAKSQALKIITSSRITTVDNFLFIPLSAHYDDITTVVIDASFANYTTLTCTSKWFYNFKNLETITGFEYLNTSNVNDMSGMFTGCSGLKSLNIGNLNTSNVTDMSSMFSSCSGLKSLNVGNLNTSNVTNMSSMFSGCSSLASLDVSKFNTANVTNMSSMFSGCGSLTSLDVSKFNTANVTNMSNMFSGCSSLTSLDVINFNTANVTNMSWMFRNCGALSILDLSNFSTSNVTTLKEMFENCRALTTIYGTDWDISHVKSGYNMFWLCEKLVGGQGTSYSYSNSDHTYAHIDGGLNNPGYFSQKGANLAYTILSEDKKTLTLYFDNLYENNSKAEIITISKYESPWDAYKNDVTTVILDKSFANNISLSSTSHWFYGFKKLTTINGIEHLNTANVRDMSQMFSGCESLTSLDVSNFNTANVTDMSWMFASCKELSTIYGSDWETSKVTDGANMFSACYKLVGEQGTSYSHDNTDYSYAHIDGGPNNPGYFSRIGAKTPYIVLSDDKTTLTMYYDNQYETNYKAEKILKSNYQSPWADYKDDITTVVIDESFADYNSLTSTSHWFHNFKKLTAIKGVEHLNTEYVTDMSSMFSGCSSLTSLDVSNFNTPNVTNMSWMFYSCNSLTSLDISNFNTANVTNMSSMFEDCSSLATIYGNDWDTKKVTYSTFMFAGCNNLIGEQGTTYSPSNTDHTYAHIDGGLENPGYFSHVGANTPSIAYTILSDDKTTLTLYYDSLYWTKSQAEKIVTSMNYSPWRAYKDDITTVIFDKSFTNYNSLTNTSRWFFYFKKLTVIKGIEHLNTANVTDMSSMFSGCSALTNLDVSNFNTSNVTNMSGIFSGCSALINLDVSNFNTSNVTDMSGIFSGCSALTNLGVSNFNTSNVTDMSGIFSGCSALTNLGVSNFNTSNVTDMSSMFSGCSSLTSIDVSNFNTSNVRSMSNMFHGCSSLTSLDVSKFNTSIVTDMNSMFDGCSSLTTIYGCDWNTEKVTNGKYMFSGCNNLIGEQGTTYSSSNTDYTYAHIDGGPNNPGYFSRVGSSAPSIAYTILSDDKTTLTLYYDNQYYEQSQAEKIVSARYSSPWDAYKDDITTIVIDESFANYTALTSTSRWFYNFKQLEKIEGLKYLNTTNVTNMSSMFYHCDSLKSLDVSNFNTTNVTDMSWMFASCKELSTIFASDWDTSKVTDGANMFSSCNKLVGEQGTSYSYDNIDYTYAHIDGGPENPGYFSRIGSKAAYSILSDDKTTLTLYYDDQFTTIPQAEKIVSSSYKSPWANYKDDITTVVIDKSFANNSSLSSTAYWFYNFKNLTIVDGAENLNTANVTDMSSMFSGCEALTTIYGNDWDTSNVTSSTLMFYNCKNLVGGKGTQYSSRNISHTYARVDRGSEAPGYFTDKNASGVNIITVDNGQNAPVYNLSGQKLTAPQKGINIIGGKKVVKK